MRPEIIKADGTVEVFDGEKLASSLAHAGASSQTAQRIRQTIESSIMPNAKSTDIYKRAFMMLRQEARPIAARYSLRRALFDLGPSGHPFEDFVAEIFKSEGWTVQWRKLIKGKCVTHEVDVYATRGTETMAAELKYHNDPGYKTDVKVALYVKARFDDIWQCKESGANVCPVDRGFLITNTKFTSQATDFAECSGIELLSWSYPAEGNLYDRIIAAGIYPITALTTLRSSEKKILIGQGLVTTTSLREHREALRALAIPPERVGTILAEVESLRNSLT